MGWLRGRGEDEIFEPGSFASIVFIPLAEACSKLEISAADVDKSVYRYKQVALDIHVILHIYDLKVVAVCLPDLLRPSDFFVLDQKPPYLSEYHEISNFDISWYSDRYGGF